MADGTGTRSDLQAKASAARRERAEAEARRAAELLAAFNLPARRAAPETVIAHLGPTNSGKSHDALALLAHTGAGTYAAPLRLLAHEAHRKLSALLPAGSVGLVTGEERVDPGAPVICCTTELAPMSGEVMVLDEVHWVDDPDRGWAWGRLLAGATYRHIRLVGALNAEPLLRSAYGAQLEVRRHQRLVELTWAGTVELATVPAGALVVAFSRNAVLALARDIAEASGRRVGALYGALPPQARRGQIEQFLAGTLDVLCVTDVIGHGINLPAHSVVMAETSKFDGQRRRPLHLWELAQIVGRAGRFGLSEKGEAFVLRGVPGLEAASGQRAAGPAIASAPIRPTLADLAPTSSNDLVEAVDAWQRAAAGGLAGHDWLRAAPLQRVAGLLHAMARDGLAPALDASTMWRLATMSVDSDELVLEIAHDLASGARRPRPPVVPPDRSLSLEEAERAAARARGLAATGRAFPQIAAAPAAELLATEAAAAARILDVLPSAIRDSGIGRCGSCGRRCPPWLGVCDRCSGRGPKLPPPRRGGRPPKRR
jgi:ATP-dependent RNA helicase SUPV3L1/SUV3